MVDGYIICGTPRSGSTLFCQYLASTGVAGVPASYFKKEGLHEYAEYWQILRPDGSYDFADYLASTRRAGSTNNGALALRIMWSTLAEVTAHLAQLYPNLVDDELALLERAFGRLKFIYLRREDVVAQAISLYRAQQTGYWHVDEGQAPEQPPAFDFDAIHSFVDELRQDNLGWQSWFRKVGVETMPVVYEDFAANPKTTISMVLRFLEIEPPANMQLKASNQRLADEITTLWLNRYGEELEKRNIKLSCPVGSFGKRKGTSGRHSPGAAPSSAALWPKLKQNRCAPLHINLCSYRALQTHNGSFDYNGTGRASQFSVRDGRKQLPLRRES